MNIRKIAAIYSIIIGIAMIGMWFSLIAVNQVPEINNEPTRIAYHLIGEFLTAIILLIGGFGLFTNRGWGFHVFLISMGMLFYTVIVSAGYYGQLGDMVMVGMFTIFQVLTVLFICLSFFKWKEFKAK
jgi:hypothetical protein